MGGRPSFEGASQLTRTLLVDPAIALTAGAPGLVGDSFSSVTLIVTDAVALPLGLWSSSTRTVSEYLRLDS